MRNRWTERQTDGTNGEPDRQTVRQMDKIYYTILYLSAKPSSSPASSIGDNNDKNDNNNVEDSGEAEDSSKPRHLQL